MCLFKVVMIIDECQEKMNCLYSLVNVLSVITNLSIFIAGGGGGEEFWREHLVFRGNGGGIRYTYSTSNTPRLSPPPLPPAPPPLLNTQYLVTVDLFFSNICRGVIGIPCTRLRHNCIVNRPIFSKICITMAVSVASQRR